MICRCKSRGAALAATLVIVAAAAIMAAAALRDTVVQTAMTRQYQMRSAARLAAFSALELAQSELPAAGAGEITAVISRAYRFSAATPIEATATVRLLSEAAGYRSYELVAEVTGLRQLRQQRRRELRVPIAADPSAL